MELFFETMAWSAPFSSSLESLLLPLVEKLLHPYIDTSELRREKLRVGIWQGNIVLTDVALLGCEYRRGS